MNLAAILGFYLFSLGFLTPTAQTGGQSTAAPAAPVQPVATASGQTTPASPAKPSRRRHRKVPANCSNTVTPANTTAGDPSGTASAAPGSATTGRLPPCPTPKKVIRNGGSNEPSIQLVGGGTAEQTAQQRTIDQLTAATTENLKKIEGRQLNPTQQDMVSQIKQFMDQSKTAAAAGDLERGNNLAMKARLLSDELVKP